MHPDFCDILAEFARHKVDYLIVGGHAVALHGAPRFTKDLDLWIRPSEENVARAKRALEDFGAPDSLLSALATASETDVLWLGRPPVRIDLVKGVPGGDFDRAFATRVETLWAGQPAVFVGLAELLRLKRASGRPQDLIDVDLLEALADPES